jgi:hypothetical protein
MGLFNNLPVELVEGIVAGFCAECTAGEERQCCYSSNCYHPDEDAAAAVRLSSLSSLCLTSRHLNSVATRHLYHRLSCKKWWLLARTLLARRDLAQLTMGMRFADYRCVSKEDCPPEVLAYFRDQKEAYLDRVPEGKREDRRRSLEEDDLYTGNGNLELDIMTSLCPNLTSLHAVVGYFHAFRFCTPQSMMRLHTVVISHADTELGLHLENARPLFQAAPNIASITYHMMSSSSGLGFALDKVTTLDLQYSAIDRGSLANVLMAFPNLETFRYSMGGALVGYEQFNVADAREALLAHAPNLKSLLLDTLDNDNYDEDWDEDEMREMGRMLVERGVSFEFRPYQWASQNGTAGFAL